MDISSRSCMSNGRGGSLHRDTFPPKSKNMCVQDRDSRCDDGSVIVDYSYCSFCARSPKALEWLTTCFRLQAYRSFVSLFLSLQCYEVLSFVSQFLSMWCPSPLLLRCCPSFPSLATSSLNPPPSHPLILFLPLVCTL